MSLETSRYELKATVAELERHNREAALLADMGDNLLAARDNEEIYSLIGWYLERLIPCDLSVLYMYNSSRNLLEAKSTRRDKELSPRERAFAPDECWALRRSKLHEVSQGDTPMLCGHVENREWQNYFCLPLSAAGQSLGLLHLRCGKLAERAELRSLLETAGSRLSLALYNLNLRNALREQSIRDPLTGLLNRRFMFETLEREIHRSKRSGRPVSVMMADIDFFKRYNDAYGHAAGDEVLRVLGLFFKDRLRGTDVACRYGGEEFLLVLPDASLADAAKRAESLRVAIKRMPIEVGGRELERVALSFGVAACPESADRVDALVGAADAALYRAKEGGRDRVETAGSEEGRLPLP